MSSLFAINTFFVIANGSTVPGIIALKSLQFSLYTSVFFLVSMEGPTWEIVFESSRLINKTLS